MSKAFQAQVSNWAKKCERRMRAVVLESADRLFAQANTVGPSVANPSGGEGGRMPVDTGFLRSSFSVSFNSMPTGPSRGAPDGSYAAAEYTMQLAGFTPGVTIYGGWTASYAGKMEHRYGFARGAAQNWPLIVRQVVADAKSRFG